MRAIEPDCDPGAISADPRLSWFIANNPTLMRQVPKNIVEIAAAMISRPCRASGSNDAVEMLRLLVERARLDTRGAPWDGTPLGWAVNAKKRDAEAFLLSCSPH